MSLAGKIGTYFFPFFVGITVFYIGTVRISSGIDSIRITDTFTANYMDPGLMYIQIGLLILIGVTFGLTRSIMGDKV